MRLPSALAPLAPGLTREGGVATHPSLHHLAELLEALVQRAVIRVPGQGADEQLTILALQTRRACEQGRKAEASGARPASRQRKRAVSRRAMQHNAAAASPTALSHRAPFCLAF